MIYFYNFQHYSTYGFHYHYCLNQDYIFNFFFNLYNCYYYIEFFKIIFNIIYFLIIIIIKFIIVIAADLYYFILISNFLSLIVNFVALMTLHYTNLNKVLKVLNYTKTFLGLYYLVNFKNFLHLIQTLENFPSL